MFDKEVISFKSWGNRCLQRNERDAGLEQRPIVRGKGRRKKRTKEQTREGCRQGFLLKYEDQWGLSSPAER